MGEAYRFALEEDANADLHVARRVGYSRNAAKSGWSRDRQRGSTRLHVVQYVGDLQAERRAHLPFLPDADRFERLSIDVPSGQIPQIAVTAAACIVADDAP